MYISPLLVFVTEKDPVLCNVRVEAKETFQISEAGAKAEEIVEHINLLLRSGESNRTNIPKRYALWTFPNLIFFIFVLLKRM